MICLAGDRGVGGDLAARDRQGLHYQSGGGFPQPIADLIVKGRILIRGQDAGMVAQSVEKLRTVGLGIDGLELYPFGEFAPLRSFGFGIEVDAFFAFPDASQPAQRPQIGQGIGIDIPSDWPDL